MDGAAAPRARLRTGTVRCPACGRENRADAAFCDGCGRRLGAPAAPADLRTYTPAHLAEKILVSRSALEGERKQVTVLFADVKGSMEIAEQVDPEEWHHILDRFFQILADGVHRFEGTVNQFTGDGIMALFGAPIAHEDHARRACFAALYLGDALRRYARQVRREHGINFSVRMGLNSGEVVVGRIGDDLRMDYTAQGHTVGLAQRMEQLAEPGTVYLTEHTARLVQGFFRLEDLGTFRLKGVQEPVRVHELADVGPLRTPLEVAEARGFSRFVGRDDETASLDAALARALEGHGQVVGVVGEPGVGKSRLCFEFVRRCQARGVAVYEAHALPHGRMIPFLPVLELLRSYFGVTPEQSDQSAREKIAGRLLLLDPAFEASLPLVFEFLGVPDPEHPAPRMDAATRQRQLLDAVRRLGRGRSRREPAVILIEDLHWIDGGSEAFIQAMVETLPETRTLLLVNFRPEYQAPWMQSGFYHQLLLQPLSPAAVAELLRELLGNDPSLDGLPERICARTGGNPFFLEEVVHALEESGGLVGTKGAYRLLRPIDEVAIPATVQAVLAARIDRLGEREKLVLQTAAVIGRKFAEPILARVVDLPADALADALRVLVAAELLYERALFPEAQYAFKHPLTQEVAYQSQLMDRRTRTHAAVARAITALYPEKVDERAALLAHHWEGAGEPLEAAQWSRRAAQWAGLNDPSEALRHWRNVRALVARLPETEETADLALAACTQMLNLSWRLGLSEAEAASLFAEGKRLTERRADARGLAMLVNRYGTVRRMAGALDEALALCQEAERLGAQIGDGKLRLVLRPSLVAATSEVGRLAEATGLAEDALARARGDPSFAAGPFGYNPYIWLLAFHGTILTSMGRLAEAERDCDEAIRLAREHGEVDVLCWTHPAYVKAAQVTGDTAAAHRHALATVEVAERTGSHFARLRAYHAFGGASVLRGEWGEAVAALEAALAIHRELRTLLLFEASTLARLAEAYLGRGDAARARRAAEEAVAVGRRRGTGVRTCEAHLALGRVLLRAEGVRARDEITATLDAALALVRQTGARLYEPLVRLERAELGRLEADAAGRRRELQEAHALLLALGAAGRAAQVAREAG